MGDAWKEFAGFKAASIDTGRVTSGHLFGTWEFLKNNNLYRMTAAVRGICGNSREEAIYAARFKDAHRWKLSGADGRCSLRFAPRQRPPVNSFLHVQHESPGKEREAIGLHPRGPFWMSPRL